LRKVLFNAQNKGFSPFFFGQQIEQNITFADKKQEPASLEEYIL